MCQLNSIMVDSARMCSGCRVLVNNGNQFACVDGPEFDASQVNRGADAAQQLYRELEKQSVERLQANPLQELRRCATTYAAQYAALAWGWPVSKSNPLPNKERIKLPRQECRSRWRRSMRTTSRKSTSASRPSWHARNRCAASSAASQVAWTSAGIGGRACSMD
jgi:hypothetical protein